MRVTVRLRLNVERRDSVPCSVAVPDSHVGRITGVNLQRLPIGQSDGEQIARLENERRAGHCQELKGKFAEVSVNQSSDSASLVATQAFT